jgi:hypothetical protein
MRRSGAVSGCSGQLSLCAALQVGNPAILDKYTSKLDEGKKKKLEEMIAEARKAMGGARAAAPAPAASSSRPATAPAGRSKARASAADVAGSNWASGSA